MKSSTNIWLSQIRTGLGCTLSMVQNRQIPQITCCRFLSLQLFIFMCRIMLRLAPNTFPHSGQPIFAWSCWCFSNDRWLMKDLGFSVHLPILHTQEPVSIWALLLWSFKYSLHVVAYLHIVQENPSSGLAFNICFNWCCLSLDSLCKNFPQSLQSHFLPFAPWKVFMCLCRELLVIYLWHTSHWICSVFLWQVLYKSWTHT